MRKAYNVSAKSMQKMLDCFASEDEFTDFAGDLGTTISEIIYAGHTAHRSDIEEEKTVQLMKQLFVFSLFCREHLEVMHELINAIEYEEVPIDDGEWN